MPVFENILPERSSPATPVRADSQVQVQQGINQLFVHPDDDPLAKAGISSRCSMRASDNLSELLTAVPVSLASWRGLSRSTE